MTRITSIICSFRNLLELNGSFHKAAIRATAEDHEDSTSDDDDDIRDVLEDDEVLLDMDPSADSSAAVHTVGKPNPVTTSIMNFMLSMGKMATAILLHPDFDLFAEFIAAKINTTVGAVMQTPGVDAPSSVPLRVPTKDDVIHVEEL